MGSGRAASVALVDREVAARRLAYGGWRVTVTLEQRIAKLSRKDRSHPPVRGSGLSYCT